MKRDFRDEEKLRTLYTEYSIREIGALYGVSGNAIWLWLKRFGIEATVAGREDKRVLAMIEDLRRTGLSYADIAQITGIHVAQIYRIKRGDTRCPQSSTVRKLTKLHNKLAVLKAEANSERLDKVKE